jgi:ubiquinone/menaquinone biosynthesis C-methylase UbiE
MPGLASLQPVTVEHVVLPGGNVAERTREAVLRENLRLHRMEAAVYDANHFEIFHPWEQDRLRRHLLRYAGCERVLDVGAGTGNLVTKLHSACRVAVDPSPEMLARLADKEPAVQLVVGVAESLPFPDEMFDLVATYSTLHHLADWSALADMCRVTRRGGFLLLEHEEAFRETGWRAAAYAVLQAGLRLVGRWYWRRPGARRFEAYRQVHWPYSESLGEIDFALTDGGQPDADVVEAELRRLGLTVRRHHYLLLPLPMNSRWQVFADATCRGLRMGHFSLEASR